MSVCEGSLAYKAFATSSCMASLGSLLLSSQLSHLAVSIIECVFPLPMYIYNYGSKCHPWMLSIITTLVSTLKSFQLD